VLLSTIQSVQKKKEGDMPLLQKNLNFVSEQKTLTPREFQVLGLIASGENYKNISEKLFISQNTFKVHLKKIFQKLLLNGRTEVVYQFNCSDIRKHFNKTDSGFN
jgi:DNA-binding NarL/FixJ family response regulator